jgi:hypothetical protein
MLVEGNGSNAMALSKSTNESNPIEHIATGTFHQRHLLLKQRNALVGTLRVGAGRRSGNTSTLVDLSPASQPGMSRKSTTQWPADTPFATRSIKVGPFAEIAN